MPTHRFDMRPVTLVAALLAGSLALPSAARAEVSETAVANLGAFGGAGAAGPSLGPLVLGANKVFYGTTEQGGANGIGAIYGVSSAGALATLHSFANGEGVRPGWGLARDGAGNLYGASNASNGIYGFVFKITPAGVFTILHAFTDRKDGQIIDNGVTVGSDGLLYGFAEGEGGNNSGTFFRMTRTGTKFTVLTHFHYDNAMATNPAAAPTEGPDGAFYGVGVSALDANGTPLGAGLFRVTKTGAVTLVAGFPDKYEAPSGSVAVDAAGDMFVVGAVRNSTMTGRIYKVSAAGAVTVLHQFTQAEGIPTNGNPCLRLASDGRIYGVAVAGGASATPTNQGDGTAFGLDKDGGNFAVLHSFNVAPGDGLSPNACPTEAADHSLWGTTFLGGSNSGGVVYKLARPTARLSLSPATIAAGTAAKIVWSSTESTACQVAGAGLAAAGTSGAKTVSPVAGTYAVTLTCRGAGTATVTKTLTVN